MSQSWHDLTWLSLVWLSVAEKSPKPQIPQIMASCIRTERREREREKTYLANVVWNVSETLDKTVVWRQTRPGDVTKRTNS